jgi:hypothetical protein
VQHKWIRVTAQGRVSVAFFIEGMLVCVNQGCR